MFDRQKVNLYNTIAIIQLLVSYIGLFNNWTVGMGIIPTYIFMGFSSLLWVLFILVCIGEYRLLKKKMNMSKGTISDGVATLRKRSMLESK